MDFNTVLGWKAEGMRFSLFTTTPITAHADWWADFVGTNPETSSSKASTGEHFYIGEFDAGLLELHLLPDRIDWVFKPNVESSPFFPSVGEFKPQLKLFCEGFNKWLLKNADTYSRLAFAVTLLHPVDGRQEGYELINKFLPFLPLSSGAWQDFYFQFNKVAVADTASGSKIGLNRLVNYSVAHVQTLTFNGTIVPMSSYFARLELDINTQVENNFLYSGYDVLDMLGKLSDISGVLKDSSEV